jgi:hypothetical protein
VPEPFLTYLTIFKSRLGAVNLVLSETSFAHQPHVALERKLRAALDRRSPVAVAEPTNERVFRYLNGKKLLTPNLRRSGRYQRYSLSRTEDGWTVADRSGGPISELPVFETDQWFADPRMRSTIGVPTPDVAGEIVDLAYQLGVLSRAKNTWTAAGQMVLKLRSIGANDSQNPFLLDLEAVAYLRQVIEKDGVLMQEVVRYLHEVGGRVTRDEVAGQFKDIVKRAVEALREGGANPAEQRSAKEFLALIQKTSTKTSSRGPGVLEHRVSPRLEWLTDLGYLEKTAHPKNAFAYDVTSALGDLLHDLDGLADVADRSAEIAISQWRKNPMWNRCRGAIRSNTERDAFLKAYSIMRRRIGPAPLREVAFLAGLSCEAFETFSDATDALVAFAKATDGVSLAGGRYSRAPENITISPHLLEAGR